MTTPKKWDPQNFIKAAEKARIKFNVDKNWLKVDPYGDSFKPVGVVWHHTACGSMSRGNMPSLAWVRNPGPYAGKARACHILVGRDGSFQFIAGNGCYHAGAGGPKKVNGYQIPKDLGNLHLIGIEIEASSTSKINKKNVQTPKWGMNPAQFEAVSKFCAALFEIMDWDTDAAIRHRDWAPERKIDVQIPLEAIRSEVTKYRKAMKPVTAPKPVPAPTPKPPVAEKPVPAPAPAPKPKPKPLPAVTAAYVKPDKKNGDVLLVQKALAKEVGLDFSSGPGRFGPATKAAYKKWQKKLGVTATGVPTKPTLKKLGEKHGFTVQ